MALATLWFVDRKFNDKLGLAPATKDFHLPEDTKTDRARDLAKGLAGWYRDRTAKGATLNKRQSASHFEANGHQTKRRATVKPCSLSFTPI